MANILVYIELVDNEASWASLLALRQARYLSTSVGATIYAVLPCATPPLYGENDIIAVLSRQGADKVILMTHGDLSPPMAFASHGEALLTAATQFPPALLLLPEGPAAVEIAPRVAARLGGLFVSHPKLSVQEGSTLRIDQPVFEDTHVLRYNTADLEHSVVAVVSPDPQQFSRAQGVEEAEVVVISPGFDDEAAPPRPVLIEEQQSHSRPERIVLVGAGITEEAEVDAIRQLAEVLKAELRVTETAAKKGVLDAPKLDKPPLVCRPEFVLAIGVRGSAETLASLAKTTYLVGVNLDEKAPLFKRAQLGLVAPALEAARQMVDSAQANPIGSMLPIVVELESEPSAADGDEPGKDALRDTLPPGAKADETQQSPPTEEAEAAPDDAAKKDQDSSVQSRPIDQLAHTPPMGTPLSADLQSVLDANADATASQPGSASIPEEINVDADTPIPTESADQKTPDATPAGAVTEALDPALDDTVPAPLPGGGAAPPVESTEHDNDKDGMPKP